MAVSRLSIGRKSFLDSFTNHYFIYLWLWGLDKRVADWFMMDSPYPSAVICLVYVVFVIMGPSLMKNRQPYQLKSILLVYNFLMVVASGYIFYEFLMAGWLNDYSLSCQAVDYSNSPKALRVGILISFLANWACDRCFNSWNRFRWPMSVGCFIYPSLLSSWIQFSLSQEKSSIKSRSCMYSIMVSCLSRGGSLSN